MKKQITRAEERGSVEMGWLKAKHYFSFGSYYNPSKMGFGALKVINDDRIASASGFGTHGHQNMEIITIPLKSAVLHEDSMGNKGEVHVGEVQVMSAGTGVQHSEHNAATDEELRLFQIWIEPNKHNVEPRYDQKKFEMSEANRWTQLVSPMGSNDDGLKIYQKAYISRGLFDENQNLEYSLKDKSNGLYILLIDGAVKVQEAQLEARDSIALSELETVSIDVQSKADVLMIEVPLT